MNYYTLLVILVIVSAILMRGYREHNKAYVIVACLMLFAIYGLRDTYKIGNDTTSSYLHLFERMPTYSWAGVMKIDGGNNAGFYLLCKVFYQASGGDYQLFITTIAAFFTICFGLLIYRYSPNPMQSILYHFGLLFFTFHFSVLKQTIAMGFVILAFDRLVKQKPFRFLALILIGMQFHLPSLVFLLAYPVSKLKPGRHFLLLLGAVLLLTFLFRSQLLSLMARMYKGEGNTSVKTEGVRFLRTKSLIMITIVVAAVIFRKPKAEDRVYSLLLELMGVAIVFQTFCGYGNIYERLADYYFQFSVVFIPMVFDRHADRDSLVNWRLMQLIDLAAPYLFCGYAIYRFIHTATNDPTLYPFRFYFES